MVAGEGAELAGWVTDSVWLLTFHVSFLLEAGERLVSVNFSTIRRWYQNRDEGAYRYSQNMSPMRK
jgi:hypothetical protein